MTSVERVEIEVYSKAANAAVVRVPGRKFPGVVLQGDSLKLLAGLAEELVERSRASSDAELADVAEELHELLDGQLLHYEAVLEEHGIELPYFRPGHGRGSAGGDPAQPT